MAWSVHCGAPMPLDSNFSSRDLAETLHPTPLNAESAPSGSDSPTAEPPHRRTLGSLARLWPRTVPDALIAAVATVLFAYVVVRATFMSFTFDEARSFILLKDRFLPDDTTSNTHYLNSFLMKVCSLVFGNGELSLRLPNVAAHLLFVVYGARVLADVRNRWLAFAAFLLVQGNPYVLDFFSLGRGYGLSLGFCMASLYYAVRRQRADGDASDSHRALVTAVLSAISNLSFTVYLLALIGGLTLSRLRDIGLFRGRELVRAAIDSRRVAFVVALSVVWLAFAGFDLKRRGELVWGGRDSFYEDTVEGLVNASLYLQDYGGRAVRVLALGWIIFSLIVALVLGVRWLGRRRDRLAGLLLTTAGLAVIAPIAQHHLLGTYYLAERSALLYIPLLGVAGAYGMDMVLSFASRRLATAVLAAACLVAGLATVHLARTANLDHTFHFGFNAGVADVPGLIRAELGDEPTPVELGTQWTNGITLDYYTSRDDLKWLKINRIDKPFQYEIGLERRYLTSKVPKAFKAFHRSHMTPGRFLLVHSPIAEQILASKQRFEFIGYWPTSKMYLLIVGPKLR